MLQKGSLLYSNKKGLIKQNLNDVVRELMYFVKQLEEVGEQESANKLRKMAGDVNFIRTQL